MNAEKERVVEQAVIVGAPPGASRQTVNTATELVQTLPGVRREEPIRTRTNVAQRDEGPGVNVVVVGVEGTLSTVHHPIVGYRRGLEVIISVTTTTRERLDDGLADAAEPLRCPPADVVEHRLNRSPDKPSDKGRPGGCPVPETYLREIARLQPRYLGEEQKSVTLVTPAKLPLAPAFGVVQQRHQRLDFGLDFRGDLSEIGEYGVCADRNGTGFR
ncbi:hypothetical protein AB0Q95_01140 [Streptomyces sp. NPDC059900]|uniref:hypothetical protein n=1 Tax=Streptomyces sp. NPDC059900 TaxID=3155816 RepID=UPI0034153AC2